MQTASMRRSIAAPVDEVFDWIADGTNWASVPGMFYSRVRPADGPEPHGVGSVREFASVGSKVTEVVTAFERPRFMAYEALASIPRIQHVGGSITFQEIPGGTEVFWTSTFQLKTPVLSNFLTRLFAPLVRTGMVSVTRTAERALTR
ncbi:SRPBCC family protein [Mycolicibacter senuensis]|uniref:SRPBCC family protein n=1 Tax=Mycolicibacter senuensis TaxID=386913 RepID=UPI000DCF01EB|nr:SRPBCC family protein [Mycolicibacter senuensis]RAU92119.1 SRPBCC family protein [Mycolicibacter senuensis]